MGKKDKRVGYGKLLDAWSPPENPGEPIGCVATSFTFSPVFFEEECLGRFLNLQSDPDEDGPVYIVEREGRLASLMCAAALVDQEHCRGSRSLRWDLIPARVPKGVLHAKVSLLCWSNVVRLIIASANLTEDGYRLNQEIFGMVDYRNGEEAPLSCLTDTIGFLQEAISFSEPTIPAAERWKIFLNSVLKRVSTQWTIIDTNAKRNTIKANVIFVSPGRVSVLEQLKTVWPDGSPPRDAYVTSPFFDLGANNKPAREIWGLLNQRGEASVTYNVRVTEQTPKSKSFFIYAPESLKNTKPLGRGQVSVEFVRLSESGGSNNDKADFRPLHLKSIWLENDNTAIFMVGSSNFTTPGLGLAIKENGQDTYQRCNLEANIAYIVKNNPFGYKALVASYLDGDKIDPDRELIWKPEDDGQDSPSENTILLPMFFGSAVYSREKDGSHFIELRFNLSTPGQPTGWNIKAAGDSSVFFDESQWNFVGKPAGPFKLPLHKSIPVSGLEVRWIGSNGAAWWPVVVLDAGTLPPPEALKDLPLDALIDILTSARPLHEFIKKWLKRKVTKPGERGTVDIDPHKRVDTSAFLLQRTRKVSRALEELRRRMEKSTPTPEALNWKLYGPVGVVAVSKAITREAKSEQEKSFLIAELALELSRVNPLKTPGALDPLFVKGEIKKVIDDLRKEVNIGSLKKTPDLRTYIEGVFEDINR